MRKLLLTAALLSGICASVATADVVEDRLAYAESVLNSTYWRVFHKLDRSDQLRLKASELEWIDYKDNLSRYDRIGEVWSRIHWLESR